VSERVASETLACPEGLVVHMAPGWVFASILVLVWPSWRVCDMIGCGPVRLTSVCLAVLWSMRGAAHIKHTTILSPLSAGMETMLLVLPAGVNPSRPGEEPACLRRMVQVHALLMSVLECVRLERDVPNIHTNKSLTGGRERDAFPLLQAP
jgi:hypothetical protein